MLIPNMVLHCDILLMLKRAAVSLQKQSWLQSFLICPSQSTQLKSSEIFDISVRKWQELFNSLKLITENERKVVNPENQRLL